MPKVAGKLASGNGRKHRESLKVSLSDFMDKIEFGAYGDLVRDFTMFGVTVLQDEHTIVAFEIVEDGDDVSIVSVRVDSKGFEVFKHVGGAVGAVEEIGVFGLIVFQAEKNGGLISLSIGDGLVVAVHLERWISFYVDSSIGVAGVGFCERSSNHFVARDAFRFGIVFLFGDTLNVTLVRV